MRNLCLDVCTTLCVHIIAQVERNCLLGNRHVVWTGNSIFLRLTWELAEKYALIGILCLFRRVRWYVGN